jgi:outer membrane protein OmpA-like peptidoglycan-associated protein
MVNVLYDMNVGLPVFPYIGAGVGYQWVKFSSHINDFDSFSDSINGTKGSFAYQLIAGVAYPLPMVPGLSLTAEYRFMQLTANRNYSSTYYTSGGPVPNGKVRIGQQSSHTFLLGMRYQLFNPPPPAPAVAETAATVAAAPAPVPAKTYLVFFDWDKYNLTPRATQIIAQAASDSKTQSTTTIDVNGYTDTSGTPVYNQGLSIRRAKAVAAQLVTDGVPASEITAQGFGDTNLLVATGPGVREPQNRRVEIVLN